MTVARELARAAQRLGAAGVESPRTDAELLAAHVLGVDRARLVLAAGFDAGQAARFEELVTARARRIPVQHLLGRAAFRHLDLAVGPGVFVPRPETELLAGWGIEVAKAFTQPVVVDLCSGSGAIALAVAQELPHARVYAVERDPEALAWLRRNAAERAEAGDRPIEVAAADVTELGAARAFGGAMGGALAALTGRVDVVLCNPPYVPDGAAVPPEVADHDPAAAVFGGPDGLAVIRPVVALAAILLRPGGAVGIEHDDSHTAAVVALLRNAFTGIETHLDLAGRPRFATAWQTDTS
ncbi:MAG TPA: peptide chain release factor N(5)-glutamine methyltransferase [Pilimelia sp.]|nr:peptide chain release factor N(5)-glutamine methyltransferase [Pilimelia sp.]